MSGAGAEPSRTLGLRVEGRVQGVGFRRFVERTAQSLGLGGWARNLTDGAVEVQVVGPVSAIELLRERLAAGPPHAVVTRVVEQSGSASVPSATAFRLLPDADPDAPVPRGSAPS